MLATSFVAIGCTEAAGVDAIESDDTVTLDVTKTYTENKTELAKLGVSGYDCWEYNDERGCYVLTLDNVNFKTTASVGLKLTAPANVENPKIVIKLVGENRITSGSVIKSLDTREDLIAKAIFATHPDAEGNDKEDFRVAFVGDGSMLAVNVNNNKDMIGSTGIKVCGSLIVANGASVTGHAGQIYHYTHKPVEAITGHLDIYSVGVYAKQSVIVSGQSALYGIGNNVSVMFTDEAYTGEHDVHSEGVCAESYIIKDSYAYGMGGETYFAVCGTTKAPSEFHLYSVSAGISARDTSIEKGKEMHVYISNSKVVGYGNWSKGRDTSKSVGIELAASDRIIIEDSIILGTADGAESTSVTTEFVSHSYTWGTVLYGITDITGSYVRGSSGDVAISTEIGSIWLCGLYCNSDMTVRDSIILGHGYGLDGKEFSNGIALYDGKVKKTLTVVDSEIYAHGKSRALSASEIKNSPDYRECSALEDGRYVSIPVADLNGDHLSVCLLYKYDVFIVSGLTGTVSDFERCDGNTYVVQPFHGYVPDGMVFSGYVDANGNEVKVGSTIQIDDNWSALYTTFEEKKETSNSSWVIWVVVIIAVIAIALLVAAAYAWRSR